MRSPSIVALLLLTAACGPPPLQTGPTVPTLVQVGGGERPVRTLTDLDDVRDVASSGERVYVATDLGLLVHPASGGAPPERITVDDGLPSNDLRAVAARPDGGVYVATAAGLVTFDDQEVTEMGPAPPVGEVLRLHVDQGGTLWACGTEGVGRMGEQGWERFGEPAACTTLVPTPEGELWIGTTRGLWKVEGDVVREHGQELLAEAHVRDVVPVRPNEVMALLQGPGSSQLGYYDGSRWYAYTVEDFDPTAVGLAGIAGQVLLLTPQRAFAISPAEGASVGVPLTPLSRSAPRQVVSYRARITPAAEVQPGDAAEAAREARRPPAALAQVPPGQPTIEAPGFVISNTELPLPSHAYLVRREARALYVAGRNLGVTSFSSEGRATALRSQDFVREQDLQIASSANGRAWTIGTHNDVARWRGDGLFRSEAPEGVVPQAIASGPQGVYVATLVERSAATDAPPEVAEDVAGEPSPEEGATPDTSDAAPPDALPTGPRRSRTVRIYRVDADGWTPVTERTLTLPTDLVATPFMGVSNDEVFWVGLRVERETAEGTRMRGVAVFGPEGDEITFHHRSADRQTDGADALRMPDEVTDVDLGHPSYAWFPSLSGAIRLGDSQAVVFGEARGVRGEVVTDLAVADNERIWVAAAEGVGYREAGTFEFQLPEMVREARPTALAIDSSGHLWGAGPRGVVFHDGSTWQLLDESTGLPTEQLVDVEVDGGDRVWLLGREQVILFAAPQPPGPAFGAAQ